MNNENIEPAIASIKDFRKQIDAQIVNAEYYLGIKQTSDDSVAAFLRSNAGRELALVRTKLQEAKMWAGKALEAIGSPFPAELADKVQVQ